MGVEVFRLNSLPLTKLIFAHVSKDSLMAKYHSRDKFSMALLNNTHETPKERQKNLWRSWQTQIGFLTLFLGFLTKHLSYLIKFYSVYNLRPCNYRCDFRMVSSNPLILCENPGLLDKRSNPVHVLCYIREDDVFFEIAWTSKHVR